MVIAPAASGFIPLSGLALLMVCGMVGVRFRGRFSPRALFGSFAYPVALVVVAVMCFLGLYAGPTLRLAPFTCVLVVCGVVLQNRSVAFAWFDKHVSPDGPWRSVLFGFRDAIIVLAVAYLAFFALETSYNDWYAEIGKQFFRIEYVIILCILAVLYFATGRRGGGLAAGAVMLVCVGIAQYFVYLFKAAAIMPSDLLALGTAAAVSGNYEYIIDARVLSGLSYAAVALLLAGFVVPDEAAASAKGPRSGSVRSRRLSSVAAACACAAMLAYFVSVPDYREDADVLVDGWFTYDCYREQGWLTSFVAVAQDMKVDKPAGYTKEATQKLVEDTAERYRTRKEGDADAIAAREQFQQLQPSVVVIMNETFSDLSQFQELHAGYLGPPFLNGLDDALVKGNLAVSVNGGGTCNTEFEFLTGNSMAFFGTGMYPYSAYGFSGCQGMARQFDDLGYTTIAIHPNFATNWGRDVIYRDMGFQTFLSLEDFIGADIVHNEVSDAATYDKVLQLLAEDDSPQFVFDVTMQNHSGYNRGGVPDRFSCNYVPSDWGSDEQVAELNEYLGCIRASDAALADFIGQLRHLDRPVVVVFFGDHQPGFTKDINASFYDDDGLAEFVQRAYTTPYFIWANYDVEGSARYAGESEASAGYLAAILMESIGAPLDDFQMTQLQARRYVPVLNLYGFSDGTGSEYLFDDDMAQGEAPLPDSSQNAPQTCKAALDLLERAQYLRFIDN